MESLESFSHPMSLLEGKGVCVGGWELWLPIILVDSWVSPLSTKGKVGSAFNFILD